MVYRGAVVMRENVCPECGLKFQSDKADCPRCVAIDMLMPAPKEPLRAVESPSAPAPSKLSNTLMETRPPEASHAPPEREIDLLELARFAAASAALDLPVAESAPETMECPRCAETIKARAKMCRFCQLDLEAPLAEPERRRPRSGRVTVERDDPPATVVHHHYHDAPRSAPSAGVAGVLSFFWCGLGQIYCGHVGRGIAFMLAPGFMIGFCYGIFGFGGLTGGYLIAGVIWLINIADAVSLAGPSGPADSHGGGGGGVVRPVRRWWGEGRSKRRRR